MRRCPARVLLLSILLAGVGHAQRAPSGTVVEGELGARLDRAVTTAAPDYWGAVLVSIRGEVVLAKGYGKQDYDKVPNGPRTLFDIGGLSGQITAIALLRLQAQKKVDLDAPLGRYFKDWPADKAEMTARQLMQGTSGLPEKADWGGGAANAPRTALAAIARAPLRSRPGKEFAQSPLNLILMALLVADRSGEDYEDAVRKLVFQPFGMSQAGFLDGRKVDRKNVSWRREPDKEPKVATALGWNWAHRGARGVLVSAYDLNALISRLLRGKPIDDRQLATLWRPMSGGDVYRVEQLPVGPTSFVQLHGAVSGYRARLIVHRASNSWIVLLANPQDLQRVAVSLGALVTEEIGKTVAAAVEEPDPAPLTPPDRPEVEEEPVGYRPTPEELQRFTGLFQAANGDAYRVEVKGRGLVVTGLGLAASARMQFGRWPPSRYEDRLRRYEDRGLAMLQRLLAGDRSGDAFTSDRASVKAMQLLGSLEQQLGDAPTVRFLGSEVGSSSTSWFLVEGNEPVVLCARWSRGNKFSSLRVSDKPAPFSCAFAVRRPDWAEATESGKRMSLSVEGKGAARVLVLEDRGGLIECSWQGR
ncbi:MAG: serine hydrolase domain-containing protein [Planctomycetota bacterium]|nr:serine hydrolase domain-containing protein [Planctomycetota bacterium]